MRHNRLTEDSKEWLVGKKVVKVGDDYIQLDNGTRIYLDESEIDMIGGEPTSYKFARRCNATGYGMNSGWVFDDDMNYFKYECDATQHAKDKGYSSLEEAYDNDICYYTEWDEVDSDEWYVSEHSDGREADKVIK